jgi:hypothetical protein
MTLCLSLGQGHESRVATVAVENLEIYLRPEDTSRDFGQSEICLSSTYFFVGRVTTLSVYEYLGISFSDHLPLSLQCESPAVATKEGKGYLVKNVLNWTGLYC